MAEVIHADQRRIAFHRQPTEDRPVVVFFHPAPGSGVFTLPTGAEDFAVVGVDRPGYGWSDPMPDGRWATVGSAADDAAAVLGALGVTRATAIGWSAGGRVALALAARHPEAVEAVVVVATPAPHEEVPWVPAPQYESLMSMRGDPADAVHARLVGQLQVMTPADPRSDEALALLARSPADDRALDDDDLRAGFGDMLEVAFRQGVVGLAQDIAGFMLQPWGFEWGAVGARTLLVHGQNDPLAGPQHGEWWQSALPNAELTTVTGAGHISVIRQWEAAVRAVYGRS
ncbi:MAG TPA: alpha/beta hydrolase [Acidimicrobiales bacterium]|nr:alpha/beta hydrolase [Acidimicrobiales bacterium]